MYKGTLGREESVAALVREKRLPPIEPLQRRADGHAAPSASSLARSLQFVVEVRQALHLLGEKPFQLCIDTSHQLLNGRQWLVR